MMITDIIIQSLRKTGGSRMEKNRSYKLFIDSARSLKDTRTLTFAGMLLALQVALRFIASIDLTEYIRISFSYLASAVAGAFLGPFVSMLTDAMSDVVKGMASTGPFFPGYTLTAALSGMTYGLCFYKRDIKLRHIIIARLIVCGLTLGLNTLWYSMTSGQPYGFLFAGRAVKTLLQYPVDIRLMLPFITRVRQVFLSLKR
jgi:ECF transporter S component (folate family)